MFEENDGDGREIVERATKYSVETPKERRDKNKERTGKKLLHGVMVINKNPRSFGVSNQRLIRDACFLLFLLRSPKASFEGSFVVRQPADEAGHPDYTVGRGI